VEHLIRFFLISSHSLIFKLTPLPTLFVPNSLATLGPFFSALGRSFVKHIRRWNGRPPPPLSFSYILCSRDLREESSFYASFFFFLAFAVVNFSPPLVGLLEVLSIVHSSQRDPFLPNTSFSWNVPLVLLPHALAVETLFPLGPFCSPCRAHFFLLFSHPAPFPPTAAGRLFTFNPGFLSFIPSHGL